MKREIVFGPPGTGKTTYLLGQVEAALGAGMNPERIGYVAFTRKAAHEAIDRACQRFNMSADDLPWFRTLHSLAFKLLGLSPSEVMQNEHFVELGKQAGDFTFEHSYNDLTERCRQGGALGDLAMQVYSFARARNQSVEAVWRSMELPRISLRSAKLFADALDEYKRATGFLDFNDFMDECTTEIPFDLLIIDEAQDLTPQQWSFIRRVGRRSQRVIMAGDDDQSIFGWAGADPYTFLAMAGDYTELPVSYRLPESVFRKTDKIVNRIRVRKEKFWRPREEEGSVNFLDSPDDIRLSDGEFLLLTRLRHDMQRMRRVCRDQGVVYKMDGKWSNQSAPIKAVVSYEAMRRGDVVSLPEANRIARYVPDLERPDQTLKAVSWEDMDWPFDDRRDWMAALTAIGEEEKEYIRRIRREGGSLTKAGQVIISTIHGAKGGEADNVVLCPDVSARIYNKRDEDEEHRVWYVGASRARKNLWLVKPSRQRFYRI